jgi:hypothetical protein
MSIDWSHLTGASLAIAIGLTAVAALAWLQLWSKPAGEVAGDAVTRAASEHLTALAQWALGALALHALCLIGNGSGSFAGWAITSVLALAATALQYPPGGRLVEDDEEEPTAAPRRAAADPHEPVLPAPSPNGPLWAGRDADARAGLWGEAVKR